MQFNTFLVLAGFAAVAAATPRPAENAAQGVHTTTTVVTADRVLEIMQTTSPFVHTTTTKVTFTATQTLVAKP